jgi:hypothetical protein
VDSERPETEEGAAKGNVIRLPVDWLGPREELVPLGPAADSDEPPTPPSASDFWGEHSADMHHVLVDPARSRERPPSPVRARQRHRLEALRRHPGDIRWGRWAIRERPRAKTPAHSRLGRHSLLWLAALAGIGVALAGVIGSFIHRSPATSGAGSRSTAAGLDATAAASRGARRFGLASIVEAGLSGHAVDVSLQSVRLRPAARPRDAHRSSRGKSSRPRPRQQTRPRARPAPTAPDGGASQVVSTGGSGGSSPPTAAGAGSTSASGGASGSSGSSGTSGSTTGNAGPASSGSGVSAASSRPVESSAGTTGGGSAGGASGGGSGAGAGGGSNSSPGPVGAGAPFGPGHLG